MTNCHNSSLWYRQPAADWNEALPLGSGSLGMMVYGGQEREILQLNEESLWSGYPAAWDNPECLEHLDEMRALLFARRTREAQALCTRYQVCRGQGSDDPYYGSYQTAGEIIIDTPICQSEGYCRSLNLETGIAETRFGPVHRWHVASHRRQVIVSRLEGIQEYKISFRREQTTVCVREQMLVVSGKNPAMDFCTVVQVDTDGSVEPQGTSLAVTGASYLLLWTSTSTSYKQEDAPEAVCLNRLASARTAGFEAVVAEEAAWMSEAMGRCALRLPKDPNLAALPTDERLRLIRSGGSDPDLCRLYFDYGRYLMIASGWGRLPANLQGVWSQDMLTPWTGDYHTNINLQMNYWFIDAVGLEEYGAPLYQYLDFLSHFGEKTAREMYGCRGWVIHTLTNPWGFTAPGQDPAWGSFICAGAWCCRHLHEHYLYTGDSAFLRAYWPVMRGCAQFYRDFLVRDPKTGYLVTAPSNSPENSYLDPVSGEKAAVTLGPTMDAMILREFFGIVLEWAEALGLDDSLVKELPALLTQLPPTKISRYGTIQEWVEDYEEWEPGHRHISQLYGLYPAWEITPSKTPELARAARETLRRRLAHGGGHTGWSRAWIINFYARLQDGAAAGQHLQALLAQSTLPNLFDNHPPFQIDGNFGGAAGILEMLAQSHDGVIRLLPALPPEWPEGQLRDLRLRGGYRVSFRWENGRVIEGRLDSSRGGSIRLEINGVPHRLDTQAGGSYDFLSIL